MSTLVSASVSPVHTEIEDERSDAFFVVDSSDLGEDSAAQWYENSLTAVMRTLDEAVICLENASSTLPQATHAALTTQLLRSLDQYVSFEVSAAEGVFSTSDILTLNRDALTVKADIAAAVTSVTLAA